MRWTPRPVRGYPGPDGTTFLWALSDGSREARVQVEVTATLLDSQPGHEFVRSSGRAADGLVLGEEHPPGRLIVFYAGVWDDDNELYLTQFPLG